MKPDGSDATVSEDTTRQKGAADRREKLNRKGRRSVGGKRCYECGQEGHFARNLRTPNFNSDDEETATSVATTGEPKANAYRSATLAAG